MAQKRRQRVNMNLDKVERSLVAQIKQLKAEYAGLDDYQVAKMELRYRLFDEIRKFKNAEKALPNNSPFVQRSLAKILHFLKHLFGKPTVTSEIIQKTNR